jgi:methyl-accepting chemotaxis protein
MKSPSRATELPVDELRAAIRSVAGVVERRVEETKSLTEREVLAACEVLGQVLAENKDQLADSAHLSRELSHSPDGPATLASVATQLMGVLATLPKSFRHVQDRVEQLAQEARLAEADAAQMLVLVEAVKRISAKTNLLALNTRIEASRLGGNEKALAVLSAEMRALSDEVTRAAEAMQVLAGSLTESLPAVAGGASRMVSVCATQSEEVSASVAPFQTAYARARQSAETARIGSQDRLERIQTHYAAVIRQLQFQDRVQQQLQFAEDMARALAAALEEVVQLADGAGPESVLGRAVLDRCRDLLGRP